MTLKLKLLFLLICITLVLVSLVVFTARECSKESFNHIVEYELLAIISNNFSLLCAEEAIDRYSQNIMLLSRLTTQIELSATDYESEFGLYHALTGLLHDMLIREQRILILSKSEELSLAFLAIHDSRQKNNEQAYIEAIDNLIYLLYGNLLNSVTFSEN